MNLSSRSATSNSLGSFLRTGSGFFLALALPPVLVRYLRPSGYAPWALAAEFAGYAALLELGCTLATATIVAGNPHFSARQISQTIARISRWLALASVVFVTGSGYLLSMIVKGGVGSAKQTQQLLEILSIPSVAYIASSYALGMLTANRGLLPAGIAIFAGRALGAVSVVIGVLNKSDVQLLAWLWSLPAATGFLMVIVLARERNVGNVGGALSRSQRISINRQAWAFVRGFTAWAAAGFFVVGLDTSIVAANRFRDVASYSIAASFPLLLQAASSAFLAPMVPMTRRLVADGNAVAAASAVRLKTRRLGAVGVIVCVPAIAEADHFTRLLTGTRHTTASSMLIILLVASVLRLALLPVSTALMALGQHSTNWWIPVVEAITNVAISLLLGIPLGGVGVALGTLIGGLVGVGVMVRILCARGREIDLVDPNELKDLYTRMISALLVAVAAQGLIQRGLPLQIEVLIVAGSFSVAIILFRTFFKRTQIVEALP